MKSLETLLMRSHDGTGSGTGTSASPDSAQQVSNEAKLRQIMDEGSIPEGHWVRIARGEFVDSGPDLEVLLKANPPSRIGADVLTHQMGVEFPMEVEFKSPDIKFLRRRLGPRQSGQ